MKKIKNLLVIAICCVLTLNTINIPNNYEISPHDHHSDKTERT